MQAAVALIIVVGLAAVASEIDLVKLGTNIWRFPNYLSNLLPALTWNNLSGDIAEWFWGWKRWLRLLGETLLIAYLGTVFGFVGAFFSASTRQPM